MWLSWSYRRVGAGAGASHGIPVNEIVCVNVPRGPEVHLLGPNRRAEKHDQPNRTEYDKSFHLFPSSIEFLDLSFNSNLIRVNYVIHKLQDAKEFFALPPPLRLESVSAPLVTSFQA